MSAIVVAATVAATGALAQRGRIEEPTVAVRAPETTPPAETTPDSTLVEEAVITLPDEKDISNPVVPVQSIGNGLTAADLGCVEERSAAEIDRLIRNRMGPSLAIDNPHISHLGDDRYLWLFNDSFLDYTGQATTIDVRTGEVVYLENVAMLQEGNCFKMIHLGTLAVPRQFEPGRNPQPGRFMWPLGGAVGSDGNLYVFWSEMQQDPNPGPSNGILRHPVSTWLAVYDPATLKRLAFDRAPNNGVEPQYGSVVVTEGEYSYLFGNSNLLNLGPSGGFYAGPFSGTKEYLARVPAGEFGQEPEYYTGSGWSSDADEAEPISDRFYVSNAMQPQFIDGRWISVVKRNEFWGNRLVLDVADNPWGPWRTFYDEEYVPIAPKGIDPARMSSYQPIILPWLDPSGDLIVIMSQNSRRWSNAVADPRYYRPRAFTIPLPE